MLQPEGAALPGVCKNGPSRRGSGVSQILRRIRDDLSDESLEWDLQEEASQCRYTMQVASTRTQRERAYVLAHRVYASCGFVPETPTRLALDLDAEPETLTLLAQDEYGNVAGTVSLVFDRDYGLPADATYPQELQELRAARRRIGEVVRLAIAPEHTQTRSILLGLINFVYVYARRVKSCDDVVIEVSPRHSAYYKRLVLFDQIGPERVCPRVQNAPSVLLRLDFAKTDPYVNACAGQRAAAGKRTLFPYFYSWFEEGAIAEFMVRQQRPMSAIDREYFGLASRSQPALFVAAEGGPHWTADPLDEIPHSIGIF